MKIINYCAVVMIAAVIFECYSFASLLIYSIYFLWEIHLKESQVLNRERITLIVMGVALCAQGLIIYRLKNPVEPPLPELVAPFEYPSDDPREIYLEGMRLFSEQGHAEAKKYFKYIYNKTGDGLFFFALAWIDYRAGRFEAAQTRVEYLILTEKDESDLKAYAYHLLGYLYYDQGQGENGLDSFRKAETLNSRFDRPKEVFRNRLGQALSLALLEDFKGAKAVLLMAIDSTAELNGENRPNLGLFYQVSAFIEWNLDNFDHAIELETACSELFRLKMDHQNESESLFRLAYYQIRTGNFSKAEIINDRALSLSSKSGEVEPLRYQINRFLLERFQKKYFTLEFSALEKRIKAEGSTHQLHLYKDLENQMLVKLKE